MQRTLVMIALCAGALRAETALVLPFFNHAKSASLDWIGESIAESVRDTLASQGLLVLDREDRLQALRRLSLRSGAELTHASVLKVGESLDAALVVYGYYEVLPSGADAALSKGSLRITARILDLKNTRQGRASNLARPTGSRRITGSPPDGWNGSRAPTLTTARRSFFSGCANI